jgi:hypothetical protein
MEIASTRTTPNEMYVTVEGTQAERDLVLTIVEGRFTLTGRSYVKGGTRHIWFLADPADKAEEWLKAQIAAAQANTTEGK